MTRRRIAGGWITGGWVPGGGVAGRRVLRRRVGRRGIARILGRRIFRRFRGRRRRGLRSRGGILGEAESVEVLLLRDHDIDVADDTLPESRLDRAGIRIVAGVP